MPVELFRSDTLLVRQVAAESTQHWVITFDHHSIGYGFDRPGFCERILSEMGISAIHVLGRGNDWYQYEDIFDALATVREATANASRRITFGSSMGGYAAVRFADAVAADAVLALSPQWTINPSRARWEKRWLQDAHRIRWLDMIDGPMQCRAKPVLVYDPRLPLDVRHVQKIAKDTPSIRLPAPYSGHPSTTFINEISLLRPLIEDILHDNLNIEEITAKIRARRATSTIYLGTLSEQQPDVRPRLALALARAGHELHPDSPLGMLSLARTLTRTGHHAEALATHRQITSSTGRIPLYLVPFAEALWHAGEKSEAIAIAKEVTDAEPDIAHLANWRAALLWKFGKRSEAIGEQARAAALAPKDRGFRGRLHTYQIMHCGWSVIEFFQRRFAKRASKLSAKSG